MLMMHRTWTWVLGLVIVSLVGLNVQQLLHESDDCPHRAKLLFTRVPPSSIDVPLTGLNHELDALGWPSEGIGLSEPLTDEELTERVPVVVEGTVSNVRLQWIYEDAGFVASAEESGQELDENDGRFAMADVAVETILKGSPDPELRLAIGLGEFTSLGGPCDPMAVAVQRAVAQDYSRRGPYRLWLEDGSDLWRDGDTFWLIRARRISSVEGTPYGAPSASD